jgi:hypothetical protein
MKEDQNRSGWNWFVPTSKALQQMICDVGFEDVVVGKIENKRILGIGRRKTYVDMLRAGLSVKNVR